MLSLTFLGPNLSNSDCSCTWPWHDEAMLRRTICERPFLWKGQDGQKHRSLWYLLVPEGLHKQETIHIYIIYIYIKHTQHYSTLFWAQWVDRINQTLRRERTPVPDARSTWGLEDAERPVLHMWRSCCAWTCLYHLHWCVYPFISQSIIHVSACPVVRVSVERVLVNVPAPMLRCSAPVLRFDACICLY